MTNPFGQTIDDEYNPFAHFNENSLESNENPYKLNSSNENVNKDTNYDGQSLSSQPFSDNTPSYQYDNNNELKSEKKGNVIFKDPVTGFGITEKDIIEKENALALKEERISNREKEVSDARANGTENVLNPFMRNYPPIIKLYSYYPENDIQEESRPILQKVYLLEYGAFLVLFLNAVGCFTSFAIKNAVKSPSSNIVFGCRYFIFGSYISMDVCLMGLYNSLKYGKALKYVCFLISYACFGLFMAFLTIGLVNFGSIGWMTAIRAIGQNSIVAGYCFIYSIIATAYVVANGWVLYISYKYFRTHNFDKKAIGEAAGMAAQFASEHKEEIASVVHNSDVKTQETAFV